MIAVIMAGGLGTRLRPLTYSIPKPLLPIGEKPILEIIIEKLKSQNIRKIILTTGYRSELIQTYFRNGKSLGVNITYMNESKPLGTAGALAMLKKSLGAKEPFLVMNGDILTKLDFNRMRDFHLEQKALLTIGMVKHKYKLAFGTLELDGHDLRSIKEKPEFTYDVSAGIYIIQPQALSYIPKDKHFTMPELAMALVKNRQKVSCYSIKEYWMAVEHIDQFTQAINMKSKWL